MQQQKRQNYTSPIVEVIPLETEGVIAGSLGGGQSPDMPVTPLNSSRSRSGYGTASTSDLENLINDILTVGQ
jgi:hypothetical protein